MHKEIIKFRSDLLVYLTHNMALPVLRIIRKPQILPYDSQQLRQFPQGSVGRGLLQMLEERNLKLLPHYAKHDIKHLLLQYDTTAEGEVCLQCFMLGNRHLSFPVIITVLFGFLAMPEYWSKFLKAYTRGKNCTAIDGWPWFALLHVSTKTLINKINEHQKV